MRLSFLSKFVKADIKGIAIATIFYAIITLLNFTTSVAGPTVGNETLSDIEIIAPYVSDKEYKILKSQFYQIDSKSKYDKLVHEINKTAKNNNIKIDK